MAARCQGTDALQVLPGVGRKTANVVLNVAYGEETFPVDTHVFRVANRTGLAKGKNVNQVEAKLEKETPAPYRVSAHHLLILHGRYVTARHASPNAGAASSPISAPSSPRRHRRRTPANHKAPADAA